MKSPSRFAGGNSRSNFQTISNESRLNGELKKLEGGIFVLINYITLFHFFFLEGERVKWLLRVVSDVKDDGC